MPFIKPEPEDFNNLLHPIETADDSALTSQPVKRKKGRSIDERRQALVDDPRTGEVEPHQVFCTICKKWIKLYKEVEYIESNWVRHVERCSIRFTNKKYVQVILSCPMIDSDAESVLGGNELSMVVYLFRHLCLILPPRLLLPVRLVLPDP